MPSPLVIVDEPLEGGSAGDEVSLSADEGHHLGNVLRLEHDAAIEVADGSGWSAPATLVARHGAPVGALLTATACLAVEQPPRIHVVQSVAKGRGLDDVVRVVTELGVDEVTPLNARRCVARISSDREQRALHRLEAIARSAARQSRRTRLPVVHPPVTVDTFEAGEGLLLVAHPRASTSLADHLAGTARTGRVTIVVGPEGGFTDDELARLDEQGGQRVGLGPTVLRTEHAASAAVAVVAAMCGRWS